MTGHPLILFVFQRKTNLLLVIACLDMYTRQELLFAYHSVQWERSPLAFGSTLSVYDLGCWVLKEVGCCVGGVGRMEGRRGEGRVFGRVG